MLKTLLRVLLLPTLFLIRLLLGTAALIVTIASAVVGLVTSAFVLLAMAAFLFGFWQNGIAFLALSLLVSPIGLPAMANWALNRLGGACAFVEGLLC